MGTLHPVHVFRPDRAARIVPVRAGHAIEALMFAIDALATAGGRLEYGAMIHAAIERKLLIATEALRVAARFDPCLLESIRGLSAFIDFGNELERNYGLFKVDEIVSAVTRAADLIAQLRPYARDLRDLH